MAESGHTGHGHGHHHSYSTIQGKFLISILLNVVITVAELVGGILANSLALISDALHNFSDVLALVMSYFGERVKDKPKTPTMTYGYKRLETLIALINALSLGAIAIYILIEAMERWQDPQPVEWPEVLGVGMIALVGNVISVLILRPEKEKNLNVKSAFLHLFYDAISAVGVMVSALIIAWTGWYPVDLVISVGISLLIVVGSFDLLKGIYTILMEGVPRGMDMAEICKFIQSLHDVQQVHHVHVWCISTDRLALSAHIVIDNSRVNELDQILERTTRALKGQYNLDHITLQPELQTCADPETPAEK